MSDNKPEIPTTDTKVSADVPKKTDPVVKVTEDVSKKPVKSKGYSNPALRAMGLPVIKVPSRNWMIFWSVLAVGAGGIFYDKYQQKQIRKKWVDRVSKYGEQKLASNELARKITIYIAPPPSDYLDESVAVFRKYVKPILNSAGIDFKIQSEDRQGVIRSVVAAEIRALRREILQNEAELKKLENEKKWYNRVKNWIVSVKDSRKIKEEQKKALLNKKYTDDINFANILGVYYDNVRKEEKVISEDAKLTEPYMQGGVLCIGRGAYKEYLHGLHEGLLGPLEKPLDHDEMEKAVTLPISSSDSDKKDEVENLVSIEPPKVQSLNDIDSKNNAAEKNDDNNKENSSILPNENTENIKEVNNQDQNDKTESLKDELENTKGQTEDDFEEEEEEGQSKKLPIPKPFIATEDYKEAKFAPEFKNGGIIPTADHISPFFQQPILVIPVHHLLGFLKTPQRIYRFYTKRYLTEEYGKATVALVENLQSPFSLNDVDSAKEEEEDWPKKWVNAGLEKKSEWTSPLVTDERVLSKLKVYDAGRVVVTKPEKSEEKK